MKVVQELENGECFHFSCMSYVDRVDKRLFYLSEETSTVYVVDDEPLPERSLKSKQIFLKVMFLCAVARPRFDEDGSFTLVGKIRLRPFTEFVPIATKLSKEAKRDALTEVRC